MLAEEQLQAALRALHALRGVEVTDSGATVAANRAISAILALLGYSDKVFRIVTLSMGPNVSLAPLRIICYRLRDGPGPQLLLNVLSRANNAPESSGRSHIAGLLLEMLMSHSDTERKPVRVRDAYHNVLLSLLDLIGFFAGLHANAEDAIVESISRSFHYELRFVSSLRDRLETDIDKEETAKMTLVLDNLFATEKTPSEDSLFDYGPSDSSQLKFECDDPVLTHLYQTFLHVCSYKGLSSLQDYTAYIRLMLNFYKKQSAFDSIELDSFECKEAKFNALYDFFVDNAVTEYVVKHVIASTSLFPESDPKNGHDYIPPVATSSGTTPGSAAGVIEDYHQYSKQDQTSLFYTLRHIVPLLNEYNLNFNNNFPAILRHYMGLIYGDFSEATELGDYEYVESIVSLTNTITDFENEDANVNENNIRETVLTFYSLHHRLSFESITKPSVSSTILMRLAVKEFCVQFDLKKAFIQDWNFKIHAIGQLEFNAESTIVPLIETNLKRRLLKNWYGKHLKSHDLLAATKSYYDKQLISKVMKDFWLAPMIMHEMQRTKAEVFPLKKIIRYWHHRVVKTQQLEAKAVELDQKNLTKGKFNRIVAAHDKISDIRALAIKKQEEFTFQDDLRIVESVWRLWFDKMNSSMNVIGKPKAPTNEVEKLDLEFSKIVPLRITSSSVPPSNLSEKLRALIAMEKYYVMRKFVSKWMLSLSHSISFKHVKQKNDNILLTYVLKNLWIRKQRLRSAANKLTFIRDYALQLNAYHFWKNSTDLRTQADLFWARNMVSRSFKKWLLAHVFAKTQRRASCTLSNNSKLHQYFSKWELAIKRRKFEKEMHKKTLQNHCSKWIIRFHVLDEKLDIAVTFDKSLLSKLLLQRWTAMFHEQTELGTIADLNYQRKFFGRMRALSHRYRIELPHIAADFRGQDLNLHQKVLLGSSFQKWRTGYEDRFEETSKHTVNHFTSNVLHRNLKAKVLHHWVTKYNYSREREADLGTMCDQFLDRSPLLVRIMGLWRRRTSHVQVLYYESIALEARFLHKKFTFIWYGQFVNKGAHLQDIADDIVSQKDIIKARELLSRWLMKYIKNIRLHRHSGEMFIQKWQVAKAKGILELWAYKAKEKRNRGFEQNSDEYDEDEFEEANTSMFSNLSPLAKKFKNQSPQESYLYTPLKQQVQRPPLTPFVKSGQVSPSRLQETSIRMKSERMDALRKHFSKAKATSSPSKPVQRLEPSTANRKSLANNSSGFIRLSPPKPTAAYGTIVPPRPPNFNVSGRREEVSPDPIRPVSLEGSSQGTTVIETEASVIDTAKKLRRITPIFVPGDEDMDEPRFTPIKKLKERMSVTGVGSLNSRPNVFGS